MTKRTTYNGIVPDKKFGHYGELEMRSRFPSPIYQWNELNLSGMIQSRISLGVSRFIEAQRFFFIATSDKEGNCDASFRSTITHQLKGRVAPLCLISENNEELVIPYFDSDVSSEFLRNITENPHIGMIFIDFIRIGRIRVNGIASLKEASEEIKSTWPNCKGFIEVVVEQAYGNCPARIPSLYPIELTDKELSEISTAFPPWNDTIFSYKIQRFIEPELIDFIESQLFFFIATANDNGHCDASFRGTQIDNTTNEKLPVAKVVNKGRTLVFPDYSGNALYNSLGNILLNPKISVIFVDFIRIGMLKVSGGVSIEKDNIHYRAIWPKAQAFLRVNIESVNSKRTGTIPQMTPS